MAKLTKKRALELLQEAVDEKGADYRYVDMCKYVNSAGEPMCIVGNVLVRAGVDVTPLVRDVQLNGAFVSELVRKGVFEANASAIGALNAAQVVQDSHEPWGKALAAARRANGNGYASV